MGRSESVFINLHCPSIIHTIDFYLALQQSFAVLGKIYFPLGYKRHKFLDLCLYALIQHVWYNTVEKVESVGIVLSIKRFQIFCNFSILNVLKMYSICIEMYSNENKSISF